MPFLNDLVYDNGLSAIAGTGRTLHLCSSEPSTFAGVASVTLGNVSLAGGDFSLGAGSPNGRQQNVAAKTGGSVTATGTATHFAITEAGASRLWAAGSLSASQVVTSGNTFNTAALTVRIPAV